MGITYLPELFKKTATGAVQSWLIGVEGTTIVTTYGQVGGKMQTTSESIKSGKNQGRRNETGAAEQAKLEAKSRWDKKKKAGYVGSIESAEAGQVGDEIEGGIVPMLAKVYEDHAMKIGGREVAARVAARAEEAARAAAWVAAEDKQETKLREMLIAGVETGDVK